MKWDTELNRRVPSTLGELRSYFDDIDPEVVGGEQEKSNILQTIDVLIDAAPGKANAQPTLSHTQMVRMVISKSRELKAAITRDAGEMSDLEVLIEGAKMTKDPRRILAVAKSIEDAARHPGVDKIAGAKALALAANLRLHAKLS